jgi:hypothetical protein
MRHHDVGPRRSQSVDALVRGTRVLAVVALLALAGGIVSDVVGGRFWARHALLASIAASVIVVMLSVAVINELLERRRRQRWSTLAQFVMLALVRDARLIWTGVLAQVGLLTSDATRPDTVDANGRIARDTPRLTAAVRGAIADDALRCGLRDVIALLAADTDATLGRWAAVMLNADVYAEVIDRHVELAGDLAWVGSLLGFELAEDDGRTRKGRSHPAALIEGPLDDERLVHRLAAITQLAEQLDRRTLDLALRTVPIEWWREQLGASATIPLDAAPQRGERV